MREVGRLAGGKGWREGRRKNGKKGRVNEGGRKLEGRSKVDEGKRMNGRDESRRFGEDGRDDSKKLVR